MHDAESAAHNQTIKQRADLHLPLSRMQGSDALLSPNLVRERLDTGASIASLRRQAVPLYSRSDASPFACSTTCSKQSMW